MNQLFDTALRIEALQIANMRVGKESTSQVKVPARIGHAVVGSLDVCANAVAQITVTWTANGCTSKERQVLDVNRYAKNGERHTCLRCPKCRRWRKRLYLVNTERCLFLRTTTSFSFICEACAGTASV